MVGGHHRLLGGDHAADRRAIFVAAPGIARADALNPGDAFGLLAVRPPDDVALERPGGRQHPLELDAGQHVGIAAEAELALLLRGELLKAGGQDDRADFQLDRPLAHGVVDGVLLAGRRRTPGTRSTGRSSGSVRLSARAASSVSPPSISVKLPLPLRDRQICRHGPRLSSPCLWRVGQKVFGQRFDRVLEAADAHILALQIAVDGFRGAFAGGHRLDDRGGAGNAIAAGKDAFDRSLQRHRVGLEAAALDVDAQYR